MAITAPTMWLDGALVSSNDATIPLMAHAPQRGSLVFDSGSFNEAIGGVALFRPRDHIARFLNSARAVGLEPSWDAQTLLTATVDVVRAAGKASGLIRWSALFAAAEPDFIPRSFRTRVAIAVQIPEDPPTATPIRVVTFADARKAAPEALDPSIKVSAAYLGPMIARRRATAAGARDVVLLDRDGKIAEAPIANVFAVVEGALWTPPTRYVLAGLTRDSVLAIASLEGIPVREAPLPPEVFENADEALLTGSSLRIVPIGQINQRRLEGAPGPITRRLMERFSAIQRGEDSVFAHWLTVVR